MIIVLLLLLLLLRWTANELIMPSIQANVKLDFIIQIPYQLIACQQSAK